MTNLYTYSIVALVDLLLIYLMFVYVLNSEEYK